MIIHEQNAVMGRANRLISYFAELILLSFKNTENIKLKQKEKNCFYWPTTEGQNYEILFK